ncbi:MAG: hypothetical protein PHN45_01175 [Methylococcales bacterium]|nr:hypothetical protein [Methylococcales bacterium]MDD5753352.1 hypothetical protein [Methylococcales bacterium]
MKLTQKTNSGNLLAWNYYSYSSKGLRRREGNCVNCACCGYRYASLQRSDSKTSTVTYRCIFCGHCTVERRKWLRDDVEDTAESSYLAKFESNNALVESCSLVEIFKLNNASIHVLKGIKTKGDDTEAMDEFLMLAVFFDNQDVDESNDFVEYLKYVELKWEEKIAVCHFNGQKTVVLDFETATDLLKALKIYNADFVSLQNLTQEIREQICERNKLKFSEAWYIPKEIV